MTVVTTGQFGNGKVSSSRRWSLCAPSAQNSYQTVWPVAQKTNANSVISDTCRLISSTAPEPTTQCAIKTSAAFMVKAQDARAPSKLKAALAVRKFIT